MQFPQASLFLTNNLKTLFMKKLIFILGLSLMTTGAFAGNNSDSKTISDKSAECCRRTAVDEDGDVLLSVSICTEGSHIENCTKAEAERDRIIKVLTPA